MALLVLAISQIICLTCGLWIHDRLLIASADSQVSASGAKVSSDAATFEDLSNSMPAVRILSILWIGGLQVTAGYLVLSRMRIESSKSERISQTQLMHRDKDLVRTRNAIVFGLAKLAEYRDQETGLHLERIALYSSRLAIALRRNPRYRDLITPTFIRTIGISSVLHDIGKVAIRDAVLRKPGMFDPEEREHMNRHTSIGGDCIRQIEVRLGTSNFLQMARDIALYHHENWDGTGYPHGLEGEQIPLCARIVALADVYDALSVKRVYKEAYPHERCVEIIRNEAARRLDPGIVETFLKIAPEFADIAARFRDAQRDATDGASTERSSDAASESLLNRVLGLDEIAAEPAAAEV